MIDRLVKKICSIDANECWHKHGRGQWLQNDSAEHGHRPPPVNMHVPTSMYTNVYICVQQGFLTWYK